ncbi:MAG TPA: 30S ribosomal protein S2, partial [Bacteroidales bacterium]|nr:30S ribosomal protein S2 [Bacteroidales bacterium]
MATDGTFDNLSKREKLQITRQRAKLEKNLGSIADMTRQPSALFVIDVVKERIAVHEAKRLGIPVFAMVDTNSDPSDIDFVIPANDDAAKSISLIINLMCEAINEGLNERKAEKDKDAAPAVEREEAAPHHEGGRRARFRAADYETAEPVAKADAEVEVEEETGAAEEKATEEEV